MSEGYKVCSHFIGECSLCSPDPSSNLLPLKHKHELFQHACRCPATGDRENQLARYNETSYFLVNSEYFYLFFPLSLCPPLSFSLSSGMAIAMATVDPVWSSCCRM